MSEPSGATEALAAEPAGPRTCQETAGFLFDHPCAETVHALCADCAKAICVRHGHDLEGHRLCTGCARGVIRDSLARGHRHGRFADEPLFYAAFRFPGFGDYGPGSWGHEELREVGGVPAPAPDEG